MYPPLIIFIKYIVIYILNYYHKKNIKLKQIRHNMSSSLAKKKRANLPIPPQPPMNSPVPANSNQSAPITSGERRPMTLPQVLSILEKRLSDLEKNNSSQKVEETIFSTPEVYESIKETLTEYESRFEMLAEQINYVKDTMMKLQTFTMDVNKRLLEERDVLINARQTQF